MRGTSRAIDATDQIEGLHELEPKDRKRVLHLIRMRNAGVVEYPRVGEHGLHSAAPGSAVAAAAATIYAATTVAHPTQGTKPAVVNDDSRGIGLNLFPPRFNEYDLSNLRVLAAQRASAPPQDLGCHATYALYAAYGGAIDGLLLDSREAGAASAVRGGDGLSWPRASSHCAPSLGQSSWASWPAPEPSALDMSVIWDRKRARFASMSQGMQRADSTVSIIDSFEFAMPEPLRRARPTFNMSDSELRNHDRMPSAPPVREVAPRLPAQPHIVTPPTTERALIGPAMPPLRSGVRTAPTRSPVYVVLPDTKKRKLGSDEQGEGDTIDDAIFDVLLASSPEFLPLDFSAEGTRVNLPTASVIENAEWSASAARSASSDFDDR